MLIHHLALAADWSAAAAVGEYCVSTLGRSLDDEGFIHLSNGPEQYLGVARRFYAAVREPLVLLAVDTEILDARGAIWRFETVPGAGDFPHLYGPLLPSDVVGVHPTHWVHGELHVDPAVGSG
ncbi:DUF952 domain-containing protein [Micrococcales bacterium 31B]|nr:DUF952 domain-containing protein [Micrococcales bacterium 31B]